MRFILGLFIGLCIGFAASVLLASEKDEAEGGPTTGGRTNGASSSVSSALDGLRKQFDEALGEAKKAQREAEEDMSERYRQGIGRSGQ